MRRATLSPVTLPDFGHPTSEPVLSRPLYQARVDRLHRRMAIEGLEALVIYGDREHVANIAWATGYDPRFEEAICVVVAGRRPTLFAGNEGHPYAEVAQGDFDSVLWQPLSLMGQPRDKYQGLPGLLAAAGVKHGMKIGLAGWKGFETEAGAADPGWFESPHYLVTALQALGHTVNAAQLFMNPVDGLRAINEVDQLAQFEFAATLSSSSVRRFIRGARPGMTEYDACRNLALNGYPLSTHINMCAGPVQNMDCPARLSA